VQPSADRALKGGGAELFGHVIKLKADSTSWN
jgi:hypothetical protein